MATSNIATSTASVAATATAAVTVSAFLADVSIVTGLIWTILCWIFSYIISCVLLLPIFYVAAVAYERSQGISKNVFTVPASGDVCVPWLLYSGPGMIVTHIIVAAVLERGMWMNMLLTAATTYILWISLGLVLLAIFSAVMVIGIIRELAGVNKPKDEATKTTDEASEPLQPDQIELTTKIAQQKEVDLESGRS